MDKPLISFCIPSYNHEKFIIQCLQSIIEDPYPNKEIVIIDDGSQDGSVHLIEQWISKNSERIIIQFYKQQNSGTVPTLNKLLEKSKGKYVSLLASDDYLVKDTINDRIDYLENHQSIQAIFSDAIVVDENNEVLYESAMEDLYKIPKNKLQNKLDIYLILHWCVPGPVFMANREYLLSIGGYNEKYTVEDRYMYLKLLSKKKLGFYNERVAFYRWHANNSIKVSSEKVYRAIKDTEKDLIKEFKGKQKMALLASYYHLSSSSLSKNKLIERIYLRCKSIILKKIAKL